MSHESQYIETFRQEAYEHLNNIEDILLDMEQDPNDQESIHQLFRAMHTIKGSGAMFGFDDISGFAHHAETLLDNVREGIVPVTSELVDLIFMVKDQIKAMLDADKTGYNVDPTVCDNIVAKMNRLLPEQDETDNGPSSESSIELDTPAAQDEEIVYRIRFSPQSDIMMSGMDPARILDELRDLGQCELMTHTGTIPTLEGLEPCNLFFSWDIILTTAVGIDAVEDVFVFVEKGSDIRIQILENESDKENTSHPRLGEILVDRGDISAANIKEALKQQKPVGEMLVESGDVSKTDVESALMEQKFLKKRKLADNAENMRISSNKLDKLINLVGEMVVTQAHMSHLAEDNEDTIFTQPVKQMERLTGELRKFALDMRMLPVDTLFGRFRRMVRDLSLELGKDVDLVIEGGKTELDKTILERLHDPLVHLIRNSIDHGLRSPEERIRNDKTPKGTIKLTAAHHGARVHITVADDGMGIDTASVRAKALKKKLVIESDDLAQAEIHDLIFMPGFSTAPEVTGVSGRGVGLDVVKQEINALGGIIKIDSDQGIGTSFHLSMPLTLAIIEGLHVKVNGRNFIIPVSQVEMCEELKRLEQDKSDTRNMVRLKGELIPFIKIRDFFKIPNGNRSVEHMAVIQAGHYRIGVVVDEILGNIQTVIKPLDPLYRQAEGISGATVMGGGTVALIIDLQELIRCVKTDSAKSTDKRIALAGRTKT
ncbi:chemotaxis protein CheA [Desulfobacterales bacterium HSG16]|nr:chemotaxis protein CheA [Desulfobacterales bacterium HSG16]